MNRKIEGVNSYTWGEIQQAIKKFLAGAKDRTMYLTNIKDPNGNVIVERFKFSGKIEDLTIAYMFAEQLETDLGTRRARAKYVMPIQKIAKACMNDILRENGVNGSDLAQYCYQSLLGPDRIPQNDDDFFFSFEIVKA